MWYMVFSCLDKEKGEATFMYVLGIESTCDETACAVVKEGRLILSNVVASQIDLHKEYGGVVPELACRRHIDLILPVLDQALAQANLQPADVGLIAAAKGPGLVGALLIGVSTAKALALALGKPFIGVNHVEAHLYAALMSQEAPVAFPCLGVVLSGGHTTLALIKGVGHYETMGQTVDDAIGEAFDKAAKMLGLPYPGGPHIESKASTGDSSRYPFKAGQVKGKPLHFSFSGLKTALLYAIQRNYPTLEMPEEERSHFAASFQRAAFEDVVRKTLLAASQQGVKTIIFGGGVTNSQTLRRFFAEESLGRYHLVWPSAGLSLDNAAMIAGLGYCLYQIRGASDDMHLEPLGRISL